jgi:antitoxin ParD1/3/4
MTITVQIPSNIEMQIREKASRGNIDAVCHLLVEALGPTVEALINNNTPPISSGCSTSNLSNDEFESLADQLADEFMACVSPNCPPLSDYAVSREGLYEEHL